MILRDEQAKDRERISQIHHAAFKGHPAHPPGAEPVEHLIVERLRRAGALTLSLVAEEGRELLGHIALSPARVGTAAVGWLLLGPVGVSPERQGAGVGSALIREALERARVQGALGVVLVGDPAYYQRFGFTTAPGLVHAGVPGQYVLALPFSDAAPTGAIIAHEAFDASSA